MKLSPPSLSRKQREEEFFSSLAFGKDTAVEQGRSHLIKERKTRKGFEVFMKLVEEGFSGLYITRQHPNHVNRGPRPEAVKVIWLSTTLGKDYVDPHNLGSLTNIINLFTANMDKRAILLDGLEYLMINNDFQRIAQFIEYVNEMVAQRKAILIISVDDRAFEQRELALLERNAVAMT